MRIPHCALYQVPHALAFLSVAFLLDCSNSFMLVLGLGIDQAVVQVVFVEPLCLFPQICFAYACTLKSVLKFVHCESFVVLNVLPTSKSQNVAASRISCFTFFRRISWRYAWMQLYHNWMVGLKLLSGRSIFLHFFSACTLISFICL